MPTYRRRFDLTANEEKRCVCGKPIRIGKPFVVMVVYKNEYTNIETGEKREDTYYAERPRVYLYLDPVRVVVQPAELDQPEQWRLSEDPVVTFHHLNGCGVATPIARRSPGCYGTGKRQ